MKIRRKVKRNRRRGNKKKFIIITVCLLVFVFILGTAYSAFSTNLSLNASGNVVERSRVIQSWTSTSNEDFHTDYYRENIVSATFLDTNEVPSSAVESWDVSADNDGGVMAYVVTNEDDYTKYDLYIGAKKGVIANEDSSYLFNCFPALEVIDFGTNFDTSNTTNMRNMFSPINQATYDDLGSSLKEIKGLENFDTSNVTQMQYMFECNYYLTNLAVENWNTSQVTAMAGMFYHCEKLINLDLSNWNTSNVKTMNRMFIRTSSLTELNLCSWDTTKVTDMFEMFRETTNLTAIYVGDNWTTENADTTNIFYNSNISSVTTGQCN